MSETGEVVTQEPLAAPEPADGSTPRVGTTYLVLEQAGGNGNGWSVIRQEVTASSADQAIRMVADEREIDTTYVAVPVRSWQPRKVVAETTTVMRFA